MIQRYLSLYFASIDAARAALLLRAWTSAPLASSDERRDALAEAVRAQIGNIAVFAYSSGRGALAACLRAAGIGAGDAVVLSSFTCLAVPTAVIAVGARPEYVDIDSASLNTPPELVIAALRPDVRAVVVQHTLGCSAAVDVIARAARERGVLVIEDCALSLGSRRSGRPHGAVGDAAIFSMELSKMISAGWGGVLTVNDAGLAQRVARDYERVPEPGLWNTGRRVVQAAVSGVCLDPLLFPIGRYAVATGFRLGVFKPSTPVAEIEGRPDGSFIARLSGTQAVLAGEQWRRLPDIASTCAAHAARIRAALNAAGLRAPADPAADDVAVTPRVPFLVADRTEATRWFAARGVELGAWFDGPLSPPPDPRTFNYDAAQYPCATAVARHIVNLPSHCRLGAADLDRVTRLVAQYAAEHAADSLVGTAVAA